MSTGMILTKGSALNLNMSSAEGMLDVTDFVVSGVVRTCHLYSSPSVGESL
jgi:hypothetical protein